VQTDVEGWLRNTVFPGGIPAIFASPAYYVGRLRGWGWDGPDVLGPLLVAAAALVVAIVRRMVAPALPLALMLPGLASLVFCLLLSPVPRYAGATVWVLAANAVVLALGASALRPRPALRATTIGVLLVTASLVVRAAERPLWLPLKEFEPMSPVRWVEERLETGFVVNRPLATDACWDAPLPCTPFPNPALRLRRAGDLGGGFMLDPELHARHQYDPGRPAIGR
jgi:hypothetical protein